MSNLWPNERADEVARVGSFAIDRRAAAFTPWGEDERRAPKPRPEYDPEGDKAEAYAKGYEEGRRTSVVPHSRADHFGDMLMPALEPLKINKVAILAAILRRNALRREAQLPLLNVLVVYRSEVAYRRSWAVHDAHYPALRDEVVKRLTAVCGAEFIRTRPGMWRVHVEATRLLQERFPISKTQHRV